MTTTKRQYLSTHGVKLPGVTEIIKDPGDEVDLLYWAGKVALQYGTPMAAARLRDEAAAYGTAVHEALDGRAVVGPALLHAQAASACLRTRWLDEPIDSEVAITSDTDTFGGTLDLVVWARSGPVIVDLKTGNHLDKGSVLLQLGGYRRLLRERHGVAADLAILWAPRREEGRRVELIELTRDEADLCEQGFIAALGKYLAVLALSKRRFPRLGPDTVTEVRSDMPF